MPNFNQSTRQMIGNMTDGLFVESGVSLYSVWGETVQRYYFQVTNRVIIHALFAEVTTTIAGAVQTVFNYIQDTPSIALAALSTVHASADTFVPGRRLTYIGGSVAATAITLSGGISYLPSTIPTILGVTPLAGVNSVGRIGFLSSVANATAGALKFGVLYTPIDPGSDIVALL
jgi:hypothetical protein